MVVVAVSVTYRLLLEQHLAPDVSVQDGLECWSVVAGDLWNSSATTTGK
jgi:hypothetical protein